MNLILLGPPGSGKGTQAKFIEESYNLKQLSTGELFRNAVKEKTELGHHIQKYMNNGHLVPDEITLDVVLDTIKRLKESAGFIFDGFPRTIVQAQSLYERGIEIQLVINFIIDLSRIEDRLARRRICFSCKREYNIKYQPPKELNICDRCKGELIVRKDDAPNIIKKRIADYQGLTHKLIAYYREKQILKDIDADLPIEEVRLEIKNILDPLVREKK